MKRQKELVLSLKNLSTLLIITYQIIVDLSRTHQFRGGEAYPEIFRKFVYVLELIIGLDMVSFGWNQKRECAPIPLPPNHTTRLSSPGL